MTGQLSDLLAKISKEIDNVELVSDSTSGDIENYYDTGNYILNAQISGSLFGGIPEGRTIGISGENSVGKTFYCVSIAKSFLDKNPNGFIVYYDSENATSKKFFEDRKLDTKRILRIPVATVEEFRNSIIKQINLINECKDVKVLIILDSIGNLASEKEMSDAIAGESKVDMTRQKIIRSIFRILNIKLAKHKIPMIITAHVYDTIGSYFPMKEIAGGAGLKYAASIIMMLSKAQLKDVKDVSGAIITTTLYKSRLTREKSKTKVILSFKKGLHPYSGLIEFGLDQEILKKDGNKIVIGDKKAFEKELLINSKEYFTKEVMDQLEKAANLYFKYGNEMDIMDAEEEIEEEIEDNKIENEIKTESKQIKSKNKKKS